MKFVGNLYSFPSLLNVINLSSIGCLKQSITPFLYSHSSSANNTPRLASTTSPGLSFEFEPIRIDVVVSCITYRKGLDALILSSLSKVREIALLRAKISHTSSFDKGGRSNLISLPAIVFPHPGLPTRRTLCQPQALINNVLSALGCPFIILTS